MTVILLMYHLSQSILYTEVTAKLRTGILAPCTVILENLCLFTARVLFCGFETSVTGLALD